MRRVHDASVSLRQSENNCRALAPQERDQNDSSLPAPPQVPEVTPAPPRACAPVLPAPLRRASRRRPVHRANAVAHLAGQRAGVGARAVSRSPASPWTRTHTLHASKSPAGVGVNATSRPAPSTESVFSPR